MISIPTSMSAAEVARLAELATGRRVLEVGSWLGHSTVAMARTAAVVHAVDWHRGDPQAGWDETLHGFYDNLTLHDVRDSVVLHVGRAETVLPLFRTRSFSFAFHDAYHETEAVAADLHEIGRLVERGGLIAVHDYGLFGVREAVDAFGPLVELTETLAVVAVP